MAIAYNINGSTQTLWSGTTAKVHHLRTYNPNTGAQGYTPIINWDANTTGRLNNYMFTVGRLRVGDYGRAVIARRDCIGYCKWYITKNSWNENEAYSVPIYDKYGWFSHWETRYRLVTHYSYTLSTFNRWGDFTINYNFNNISNTTANYGSLNIVLVDSVTNAKLTVNSPLNTWIQRSYDVSTEKWG